MTTDSPTRGAPAPGCPSVRSCPSSSRQHARQRRCRTRRDCAALMTDTTKSSFQSEQRAGDTRVFCLVWVGASILLGGGSWGAESSSVLSTSNSILTWLVLVLVPLESRRGKPGNIQNRTCPVMTEGPKSQICRQPTGSGLLRLACLSVVSGNIRELI